MFLIKFLRKCRQHRQICILKQVMLACSVTLMLCSCNWLTVTSPLTKADAIVLLAGNYTERTPAAAKLHREGYAKWIILTNDGVFSSWSPKYGRNLYLVEWTEEELIKLGVPRARIIRLPFYKSGTIYDALAVQRYALDNDLKKIILVTSDFHTRRTLWTFTRVFSDTKVDFRTYPARSATLSAWIYTVELTKLVYYRLRYGWTALIPKLPALLPHRGE